MKTISGKIKDIKWDKNSLYIFLDKDKISIPIIEGTINVLIQDSEGNEVGINYIEIGDIIKIILKKNDIIKIFTNTKYNFISSSSESDEII